MLESIKCTLFHGNYHVQETRSDGMSFKIIGGECTKCRRRWIRGIGTAVENGAWAALAVNPETRDMMIIFSGDYNNQPPEGYLWWQEEYCRDRTAIGADRLFLDDTPGRLPEGWKLVQSPQQMIRLLAAEHIQAISLDHDLGDDYSIGTGYDVIEWIEKKVVTDCTYFPPYIYVHSRNPSAVKKMQAGVNRIYDLLKEREKGG